MPQGKGTYGSQVGRPSKKGKKKYNIGGNVDPFSTRNPTGVPATQLAERMENQNMANAGLPTSNAQERSQLSPDVTSYKEGGKVREWQKNPKEAKGIAKKEKLIWKGKEVKWAEGVDVSPTNKEQWLKKQRNIKKRLKDKSSPKGKK